MIIEKNIKITYDITEVHKFMNYETFVSARKNMRNTPKTCFLCNKRFENSDTIYLAFIRNNKNHIVCESCANLINSNKD